MRKFQEEADGQEILENLARWVLARRTKHMTVDGCVWILLRFAKKMSRFVDFPVVPMYSQRFKRSFLRYCFDRDTDGSIFFFFPSLYSASTRDKRSG